jgi:hypothetical protein
MKTSLRLTLLLGLLLLIGWIATDKPAMAVPVCDSLAGRSCQGSLTVSCTWLDGSPGFCTCDTEIHHWDCV